MSSDDGLTPNEWTVLRARAEGKTLAEAGRLVGRGRERARQLEAQAAGRMWRRLSPDVREQGHALRREDLSRRQYAQRRAAWLIEQWALRDSA